MYSDYSAYATWIYSDIHERRFKDYGLDVEAKDQDVIQTGRIYVAPGDYHLIVNRRNGNIHTVGLTRAEK